MKIEMVAIKSLVPNEKNPRKISKTELNKLKRSIESFGFVDPVIVNKNKDRENIVIGGHQRLKAAEELGMVKVPVVYVDLPKDEEHLLNVALNNIQGDWDDDKLAELLKDLKDSDVDLSLTGFEDKFIDELLKENKDDLRSESVGNLGRLLIQCPKCDHKFKKGESKTK